MTLKVEVKLQTNHELVSLCSLRSLALMSKVIIYTFSRGSVVFAILGNLHYIRN